MKNVNNNTKETDTTRRLSGSEATNTTVTTTNTTATTNTTNLINSQRLSDT